MESLSVCWNFPTDSKVRVLREDCSAPTDSTVLLCIGAGSGAWFELFELVFVQVSQLEVGP